MNHEHLAAVIPLKIANKLLKENENEAELFVRRLSVIQGTIFVKGYHT